MFLLVFLLLHDLTDLWTWKKENIGCSDFSGPIGCLRQQDETSAAHPYIIRQMQHQQEKHTFTSLTKATGANITHIYTVNVMFHSINKCTTLYIVKKCYTIAYSHGKEWNWIYALHNPKINTKWIECLNMISEITKDL